MMKIIVVLVFQLLMAGILCAQTDSIAVSLNDSIQQELNEVPTIPDEKVYEKADVMPEFPGGPNALRLYISQNVVYPRFAAMDKEQGRVYVTFIVEPNGTIKHAKIARGVSPELDAEAIRVVKKMPDWSPGLIDGKPVRVALFIPINFRLQ